MNLIMVVMIATSTMMVLLVRDYSGGNDDGDKGDDYNVDD